MKDCNKKKRRGFFSLFSYFGCENCYYLRKDETQVIGRNTIYIYSIVYNCELERVSDELICFNKRLANLLIELHDFQKDNIILWLDGQLRLEDYDDVFSNFFDLGYNIHIIRT